MKRLASILLLCLSGILYLSGTNAPVIQSFTYHIDFLPAFSPACHIDIIKTYESGEVKITLVQGTIDSSNKKFVREILVKDSSALTQLDFNTFFNRLDTISLATVKTSNDMGLDGITILNAFTGNGIQNEFGFWSPHSGTKERQIAEAVLQLSKCKFRSKKEQEYFKLLDKYFE